MLRCSIKTHSGKGQAPRCFAMRCVPRLRDLRGAWGLAFSPWPHAGMLPSC